MRLHAPDDGAVAVLVGGLLLLAVGTLGELGDLAVDLAECGHFAADGHVVRLRVKREVGAKDLRIVGLVHLQPLEAALGGVVHALGALEVRLPVPLLAGVLLDEGDGIFDLLCSVILHVVLAVAQGRCQLEHRNAVLKLEALGNDAVSEQGAVARRVALHGARAEHRRVVVDGHAGFRLRHRADIAREAVLLRDVDIMLGGVLVEQHGDIGRRRLTAQALERREAHHDGGHLVFVHEHDLVGEFLVLADAAVAAEETVEQLCHVLDDKILLQVADAQIFVAQALGVAVDHHGHGQIVGHPAIAEHGLDVARLGYHLRHGDPVVQPAGIIIERVGHAAPLAAVAHLSLSVELAEIFAADSLVGHHCFPP